MKPDSLARPARPRTWFSAAVRPWMTMLLPAAVTAVCATLILSAAILIRSSDLPIPLKLLEVWATVTLPAGLFIGHCILTGE